MAIQYIWVMESGVKPVLPPTYLKEIEVIKICYTNISDSQSQGGAFSYRSVNIKSWKS
jgi:hypothetical protein